MKLLTVTSALLLVGNGLAAPNTALRRERALERRARSSHVTRPLQVNGLDGVPTNETFPTSENWAGAVLVGSGYTSVTGTFTVPTPSTTGSGSAWVGIDGYTCGTAILQTGIDWTKSGSSITYDAWYEWYPDYAYDFSGFSLEAGDSITATVTATSKTGGTAKLTNHRSGASVTHTFSNEASEGSLCETNAEWIVEDFEENGGLVTFADFGTVTFTSCSAVDSGTTVGTTGATIFNIEQKNKVLTSCSVPSSSEVTCTYE